MNIGISTASFYPMTTENALMEIGKGGAQCTEVFFNTFGELNSNFVKEMREMADFYELDISAAHPFTCSFEPFLLFTAYPRRFDDGLNLYRSYFEAMNILNCKLFVFHGDRAGSTIENHEYFERYAKLSSLAKEYGVTVAQENVERCKSRSVQFLCEMAEYLKGDLSVVFDNKQALRSGVDYNEFIDRLGSYICHVHLSDNNQTNDCMPLGRGTFDIEGLLKKLNSSGFDESVIIELYHDRLESNEDIFESYEYLRTLIY